MTQTACIAGFRQRWIVTGEARSHPPLRKTARAPTLLAGPPPLICMPWIVLLHIAFICLWVAALVLVLVLCAEREVGQRSEDESLVETALHLFALGASLSAVLGVLTGSWLAYSRGFDGGWLPAKLAVVGLLGALHVYVGRLTAQLRDGICHHQAYYWTMATTPPLVAVAIFYLVLAKPF